MRDGIRAIKGGSHAAAQALFTVTLDTLITKLIPDATRRSPITKRKTGHPVPAAIDDMGLRRVFVWLPIWNSHGKFWASKGHNVPSDYSRHASVHAVSRVLYSKRNCIQALMLITSLLGYTQQLIDRRSRRET